MRRLRRILLNVAMALSLLLCTAVVLLWVRAGWAHDWFAFATSGGRLLQINSPTMDRHTIEILCVRGWPAQQAPTWIAQGAGTWIRYDVHATPGMADFRRYERLGLEFAWGEAVASADNDGPLLRFYDRSPPPSILVWGHGARHAAHVRCGGDRSVLVPRRSDGPRAGRAAGGSGG